VAKRPAVSSSMSCMMLANRSKLSVSGAGCPATRGPRYSRARFSAADTKEEAALQPDQRRTGIPISRSLRPNRRNFQPAKWFELTPVKKVSVGNFFPIYTQRGVAPSNSHLPALPKADGPSAQATHPIYRRTSAGELSLPIVRQRGGKNSKISVTLFE
jgi:hypothetical protein